MPVARGAVKLGAAPALSARGGRVGGRRRRLAREDLEALRQEFVASGREGSLHDDLHQLRRGARLGITPEDCARKWGVPIAYARALRRYLEQE